MFLYLNILWFIPSKRPKDQGTIIEYSIPRTPRLRILEMEEVRPRSCNLINPLAIINRIHSLHLPKNNEEANFLCAVVVSFNYWERILCYSFENCQLFVLPNLLALNWNLEQHCSIVRHLSNLIKLMQFCS